jgi:hypothetical protein
VAVLALVAGLVASRVWPRCPHCGARVIRSRSDWLLPGSYCEDCDQPLDGARLDPFEARKAALRSLGGPEVETMLAALDEAERSRKLGATDSTVVGRPGEDK